MPTVSSAKHAASLPSQSGRGRRSASQTATRALGGADAMPSFSAADLPARTGNRTSCARSRSPAQRARISPVSSSEASSTSTVKSAPGGYSSRSSAASRSRTWAPSLRAAVIRRHGGRVGATAKRLGGEARGDQERHPPGREAQQCGGHRPRHDYEHGARLTLRPRGASSPRGAGGLGLPRVRVGHGVQRPAAVLAAQRLDRVLRALCLERGSALAVPAHQKGDHTAMVGRRPDGSQAGMISGCGRRPASARAPPRRRRRRAG